ncbi:MMPL/RND family transporter [Nocardia pseudobrasiliensis]|uniref:RND superfamily putative drug exporter n=1 Tax=Nocardia pseudobrasiliensis TaxID=45979 RepID=A0A370I9J4_9NOCA|nr:RND family transporter [Nocardia pseudobrasiliensis]RDI67395.1 RND superfamily putative drug exporter [Nocardia pseudobrasiliensis]
MLQKDERTCAAALRRFAVFTAARRFVIALIGILRGRDGSASAGVGRPTVGGLVRRWAPLVVLAWVGLAGAMNLAIPQLERVIADHSREFVPANAASAVTLKKMGADFHESDTNNVVFVLLERPKDPLGDADHRYYSELLAELQRDRSHVQSAMDVWSNPQTAVANQSADGKAAYVMLRLTGEMGTTQAQRSIEAVRAIVSAHPKPLGLNVFVTGPSATAGDEIATADHSMVVLTVVTGVLILLLLLVVYRSLVAAAVPLMTVGIALAVARAVIALLGEHGVIEVSIFASALASAMILGAGTDYAIFFLGRYQEGRRAGRAYLDAYHNAFRSVAPVILASALTIAAACACMRTSQLGLLRTSGMACAIGMLVGGAAALTLTPALVEICRHLGFLEPRPTRSPLRWRRIGASVARWPIPIATACLALLLVCAAALPSIRISYNERAMQPDDTASNLGYQAADRHFPKNRMSPDFLLISADHDLRDASDLTAVEQVSASVARIADVSAVQSITRPLGTRLEQGSVLYQAGYIGNRLDLSSSVIEQRLDDLSSLTGGLQQLIGGLDAMSRQVDAGGAGLRGLSAGMGDLRTQTQQMQQLASTVTETVGPARPFVDGNPNCGNDPACSTARQLFDSLDAVGQLSTALDQLSAGTDLTSGAISSLGQGIPAMENSIAQMRTMASAMIATVRLLVPQLRDITAYLQDIGRDTTAMGSGPFHLPQQALSDPRFQTAMKLLISGDGRTARVIVYGENESFSGQGIDRSRAILAAAKAAIKDTSLQGSSVSVGGVGATMADIQVIADHDFRLLMIIVLILVFLIVLIVLRSLVAAVAVLGTVLLSYVSALGVGVLIWQHLLGQPLHWAVPPLTFIALVAVGADYNLLFTSRFKEEAGGGLATGLIRAFAGTGGVVTTAGIVFGITMFALVTSSNANIMQIGSIIGIGLLLDTLVVRTFLLPAVAMRLGQWFWWPLRGLRVQQ